jgi:nucleotide-binding universal stress UspA family protein
VNGPRSRSARKSETGCAYDLREQGKQKAQKYLAKVSEDLKQSGLAVQTEIIGERTGQHPAEVILDYADNNKVDLIVITTHGRSGVSRWAFGSEADKIVNHSKIPVLTITPTSCRI